MRYLSTRGGIAPVSFCDAVMMGLATDGGLLLPENIPAVSARLAEWRRLSYPELASQILPLFIDDIPPADLDALIARSYATFTRPEITPVVRVGDLWIQELFHGPTLAFKDLALQLLGNLFEYVLARRHQRLNILAATSGDTGSAAICGVRGKAGIHIFVLHPHQRVSPVQERQMTSVLDANVHNLAICGTFDDGQRIIKALFNDLAFKEQYALGAVNSVNWARVAAQIVYYFYGAFRVQEHTGGGPVQVCVPTGNFGNVFAGYLAVRMGAPISRLILATNANDILARFFATGVYRQGTVSQSLSPSMDIQVASNFERYLYYRVGEDPARLKELMQAFSRRGELVLPQRGGDPLFATGAADDTATIAAIRECHQATGYVLDPHTAVGVAVARLFQRPGDATLCLATAHPAKFEEAVVRALGKNEAQHPLIAGLLGLPTRCAVVPAEVEAVRAHIVAALRERG